MKEKIKEIEKKFREIQKQGAVHEAKIVEHQNALHKIREELLRLQGEWRAINSIISNKKHHEIHRKKRR